jgi:HlyD family secretion protein
VAPADALPVTVVQPLRNKIVRTVRAPGDVEAARRVEIRSEVPARIEEMPVEENDQVEAGQLLCRLNDDQFRAIVESSEAAIGRLNAAIRQAEADVLKAERDCARQEQLAQHNATSDTELADYRTALIKFRATVEMREQERAEAEAMVRRAKEDLRKTIITSPINGVVSQIFAKEGEVVVTGTMNNPGTNIMIVTDLSQMEVRARVDETDVALVMPDQPVDIFLPSDPQRAIPGRVLRVATAGIKPAGRDVVTFETLILVESDDSAIKPGMTSNVEIHVAHRDDALTVPIQAVVHRKRKDLPTELLQEFERDLSEEELSASASKAQYVKVIFCMSDDEAEPHIVRTGIADENNVEVTAGLAEKDTVIIGPYRTLDQLKDGTSVKLDEPKQEDKKEKKGEQAQLADDGSMPQGQSASNGKVASAE